MKNAATWPRNVTNKGIVLGSSNYRTPITRGRQLGPQVARLRPDHPLWCGLSAPGDKRIMSPARHQSVPCSVTWTNGLMRSWLAWFGHVS